ncbi:MAG: hypothetical protein ACW98U_02690 [Candidatus Thorarchaeota archaeon]
MSETMTHYRRLKLHVIIPKSNLDASDVDLRMSLVTLKNVQRVVAFYESKIEKELKKRGVSKYIIHQSRDT